VITSERKGWARNVACLGTRTGAYRILVEKPRANSLLGRPRCRWDDNVMINVGETGRSKWHGL
jgi:hypothetical protein